ncbi:hypothetical protein [Tumidithrix helvetica]|uniref:hypothetical protein n=1 Tax=Tumidithrix helvetica TaxID=3457545 RepID=UPI003CC6660A
MESCNLVKNAKNSSFWLTADSPIFRKYYLPDRVLLHNDRVPESAKLIYQFHQHIIYGHIKGM